MKPCILIGHCPLGKGAYHKSIGSEYDYNLEIAFGLRSEIDVFTIKDFKKGYTNTIKQDVYPMTKDYDLVLELHFNAVNNSNVNGCEALYWHKNTIGKKIAEKFCKLMNEEFGSINRGAKPISNASQRGYATFAYQKPTVVLLEPFFCTGTETEKFNDPQEKERYRNVIRKLLDWVEDEKLF